MNAESIGSSYHVDVYCNGREISRNLAFIYPSIFNSFNSLSLNNIFEIDRCFSVFDATLQLKFLDTKIHEYIHLSQNMDWTYNALFLNIRAVPSSLINCNIDNNECGTALDWNSGFYPFSLLRNHYLDYDESGSYVGEWADLNDHGVRDWFPIKESDINWGSIFYTNELVHCNETSDKGYDLNNDGDCDDTVQESENLDFDLDNIPNYDDRYELDFDGITIRTESLYNNRPLPVNGISYYSILLHENFPEGTSTYQSNETEVQAFCFTNDIMSAFLDYYNPDHYHYLVEQDWSFPGSQHKTHGDFD